MTAIINYGVGNLFSLVSSLKKIGEDAVITNDVETISSADRIILPGVGAFSDAAEKLYSSGLISVINKQVKKGVPLLGICLGMQLLFDKSFEYGEHKGLSLISGEVVPIPSNNLKIPHMGWNCLTFKKTEHPLFKYINDGDCVYFVHSYYATNCFNSLLATTEYGEEITAAVAKNNVMGCQFHPEKSGNVGLNILKAFCEIKVGALC